MAFSIQIIDRRRRIGQVEVGSFTEPFRISGSWSVSKFESEWHRQLSELVARKRKAMLPESATSDEVFRAWILYRDDKRLYVQQRYYFRRPFRYGKGRIHARRVRDEDGQKLSEWSVPFTSVITFLKRNAQQIGTGQPATRSELKPEGGDKPQPEAEGRSR